MTIREARAVGLLGATLGLLTASGCSGGEVGGTQPATTAGTGSNAAGSAGTSGGGRAGSGSGGSGTVAGASGTPGTGGTSGSGAAGTPSGCVESDVIVPKRIIRLSFNQIANTITSLFDQATSDEATATVDIPSPLGRTFPPLGSGTEGNIVTDSQWSMGDTIAQNVAAHVFENVAAVTGCGAAPTAECGRTYVSNLADRAFRRPLTDAE
ncbi:MAG TPA: hypothetical protein VGK73_07005, partial [Polyangiaceae bacterium]